MSNFIFDNDSTLEELRAYLKRVRWVKSGEEEYWLYYILGIRSTLIGMVERNYHLPYKGWEHHIRRLYHHNGEVHLDRLTVKVDDRRQQSEVAEAEKEWGENRAKMNAAQR